MSQSTETSYKVQDLMIDLCVDLGLDSVANAWGGYDMTLADGETLRVTYDDGGIDVLTLTATGVLVTKAAFSSLVSAQAVYAYAMAAAA